MRKTFFGTVLMALMCFMMMPTKAFAENSIVNEISITMDMDKIDLNTAWTEAEVEGRVYSNTTVDTAEAYLVDEKPSCGLGYKKFENDDPKDWMSYCALVDVKEYVSAERTYAFRYYVKLFPGYDWPEGVKSNDFSSMTIKVDGVDVTSKCALDYCASSNELRFYYLFGSASTEKKVTKISIAQTSFSLKKGDSKTLTATVQGTVDDKSVVWSIDGAKSASTSITSAGVLTIGEDETATSIKVTATSKADANKKASISVKVLGETPTIESIKIIDPEQIIRPGDSFTISATVNGSQTDKRVTWSISGNVSAGTTISNAGRLSIARDETAEKITVTATSVADPTKSGSRELTITPPTRISEIKVNFDTSKIPLTNAWTEGEVQNKLRTNTIVETAGTYIDSMNTFLMRSRGSDAELADFTGVFDGDDYVSLERMYAFCYGLRLKSGYEWPTGVASEDFSSMKIVVNGNDYTAQSVFSYNSVLNSLDVIVRIGKAQCAHPATSLKTTISKATPSSDGKIETKCTVCGKVTETIVIPAAANITLSSQKYTYNGKEKKPSVVVKDRTGKVVAPENYSVAYASGRKKVGAYAVTVTFKGDKYSGSNKLTYNINPAKVSLSSVKAASKSMTVKWKKGKDVNGYEIQYSTSSSFKSGNKTVKVTSAKTTSKVIKKLKANKKYYVRIRTYKSVNGKKFYSDWSGKKTVKIKK